MGLVPDAVCYAAALSALRNDCDNSVAVLREMRDGGLAPAPGLYVEAVRACRRVTKEEQVRGGGEGCTHSRSYC